MLDKIIRELTSKTSSQQITSNDLLAWVKRVEVQRVQASILNDITETKTFDKVKKEPDLKKIPGEEMQMLQHTRDGHAGTVGKSCTQTMPSIWENMHCMWQDGTL